MIVIAHRGSCMEKLENSFSAFELAIDQSATRLEFDVQLSKDGHAVVIHDDTFIRTAQSKLAVHDLTRKEIESIKLNNDESVPFLDQVLERFKGRVEFNIELKGRYVELTDAVATAVKASGVERDDVIFSSFQYELLESIKKLFPEWKLACLWGPDTFWPELGFSTPISGMKKLDTKIVHPWVGYITPEFIKLSQGEGWTIYGYVDRYAEIPDPIPLWENLLKRGVDGLCTNWPARMSEWKRQKGI